MQHRIPPAFPGSRLSKARRGGQFLQMDNSSPKEGARDALRMPPALMDIVPELSTHSVDWVQALPGTAARSARFHRAKVA